MNRLLAIVTALTTVGAAGCFGFGIAAADETPTDRHADRRDTAAGDAG